MSTSPLRSTRVVARLVAAGAIVAVLASCVPLNSSEANLFVATNNLRKANGLAVYGQQDALQTQARSWAASLAARQQLAHSDPHTWNVAWSAVAENVGVAGSIEQVITDLEASAPHRANLLSTQYTHMAVGTARGKDGRIYAVQLFWHA